MSSSDTLRIRSAMERLGFDTFKSAEQEMLIHSVTAGQDALGIMPTGAGKSAAFIVPTIARKMKTVVVSPLIALMTDQVNKLLKNGVRAFALHGETPGATWSRAALAATQSGHAFFYVSPETLLTEKFASYFPNFRPDLLAIDEAHCVSTWGESFRPHYLRIVEIAKLLGNPQCLALSATLDPLIERDVIRRLPIRKDRVRVAMSPFRENLKLEVRHPGRHEKFAKDRDLVALVELKRILREDTTGAALVYCHSRAQAGLAYERSIRFAKARGYTPILFHSQVPQEDKQLGLEAFVNHARPLVFCTSAFGMGIDRGDVRTVVHFDTPTNLVDYAQQIGRGGRDDKPTRCITFYNQRRLLQIEKNAIIGVPTIESVEAVYRELANAWMKADKAPDFSIDGHVLRQKRWAEETLDYPGLYNERLNRGVGLLRQVKILTDDEKGVSMRKLIPGSDKYQKLLELTEMSTRRAEREIVRIQRFFESPYFSQELLWRVIGEK